MIRRGPREQNFTVLPNNALTDERLSFKARGLLAFILSKPDHWKTSSRRLVSAGPDGLSAIRAGLSELQACGYAVMTDVRNPDGKFAPEWVISDTTVTKTEAGFSDHGFSEARKPVHLVSTEGVSTEGVSTEKNSNGRSDFQSGEHICGAFCDHDESVG